MRNAFSVIVRFLLSGLAAVILVGMYAAGMTAISTPARAHGWHCAWVRGHRHLGACPAPGVGIFIGPGRGRGRGDGRGGGRGGRGDGRSGGRGGGGGGGGGRGGGGR